MAEFTEVCRQAIRKAQESGANGHKPNFVKLYISAIKTNVEHEGSVVTTPEELEAAIMGWATENPEVKYPSWDEAWKQAFPNNKGTPCPMCFDRKYKPTDGCGSCKECKKRPIPAGIAEMLNIELEGGEENG